MYCNHCGKQVEDDALYCPFCGAGKAEYEMQTQKTTTIDPKQIAFEAEAQRVKDQLATKRTIRLEDFQADAYNETDVDPFLENASYSEEMKKLYDNKSPKSGIKKLVIALILLFVICACGYFFILPMLRPKTPLDKLITAIDTQNQVALSSIFKTDETGALIKERSLDPFFELLKNDDYRTFLIDALKSDRPNDIVTIENGDQTTFSLRKYPITLKVNLPDATLNGPALTSKKTAINGEIKTDTFLTGQYHFTLTYAPVYGLTTTSRDLTINLSAYSKNMQKNNYIDEIKENIIYVSLPKSDEDALIYVNGKATDLTVKDARKLPDGFGPILKGSSITLEKQTDLGVLSSTPVVVDSPNEPLVFNFDSSAQTGSTDLSSKTESSNNPDTADSVVPQKADTNIPNKNKTDQTPETDDNQKTLTAQKATVPKVPDTQPAHQPEPVPSKKASLPSNWGYSLAALHDAEKGIVSDQIKTDLINTVKTYFKEDVVAAKTQSMRPYTNLINPQWQRNTDWVADLKQKQLKIEYDPTKLLIWNNSFTIEEKSGTWYATLSDTYYAHYQVYLKGKKVEDDHAIDRFIHMLKYDQTNHQWNIYKIEIPSVSTPNNVQTITLP